MPIHEFAAQNFRCLVNIELEADPHYNLIFGSNASGKTSVLEALGYLGRGKSFRGAATGDLVRHGQQAFVLFGKVSGAGCRVGVGVRNGAAGLEIRIGGDRGGGAAALAAALPLQVMDAAVHDLVAGPPEVRRRYLDWVAFHVEPGYLESWRRFRRALRQRNAALREGAAAAVIEGWDAEFVALAGRIDTGRRRAAERIGGALGSAAGELLGSEVRIEYRSGWAEGKPLAAALEASLVRDRQQGSTQAGPQRADLHLLHDARRARRLVSRGQEKLLGAALVLAATETAQAALEQPLLLLIDDPAAELDEDSRRRLMRRVAALDCQVVATSLTADAPEFPASAALFHVEQGQLNKVG